MKKLLIALTVLMMSCLLSGCAFSDWLEDVQETWADKKEDNVIESSIDDITDSLTNNSMTIETANKGVEAGEAWKNYREVKNSETHQGPLEFLYNGFANELWGNTAVQKYKENEAKSAAESATTDYELALATDPIHKAEVEDAEDTGSNKDRTKTNYMLIIIVVVVIIIILLLLLNGRSKKPVYRPVAAPVSAPVPVSSGQLNANKMNACRKAAKRVGLDADKELPKYNGDVDALYSSLVAMQPLD